jgi:hypothetical protein
MKPHGTLSKSHVFNERLIDVPLLLYGVLFICAGMLMYLFGVLMSLPRLIFGLNRLLLGLNEWIVWYSGKPNGGLIVMPDLFMVAHRVEVTSLAARYRVPTISPSVMRTRRMPELLVAIQPRVSLAARPEKREYSRQFGSHPGNPV